MRQKLIDDIDMSPSHIHQFSSLIFNNNKMIGSGGGGFIFRCLSFQAACLRPLMTSPKAHFSFLDDVIFFCLSFVFALLKQQIFLPSFLTAVPF
jgi:hypothetical protein